MTPYLTRIRFEVIEAVLRYPRSAQIDDRSDCAMAGNLSESLSEFEGGFTPSKRLFAQIEAHLVPRDIHLLFTASHQQLVDALIKLLPRPGQQLKQGFSGKETDAQK